MSEPKIYYADVLYIGSGKDKVIKYSDYKEWFKIERNKNERLLNKAEQLQAKVKDLEKENEQFSEFIDIHGLRSSFEGHLIIKEIAKGGKDE